MFGPNSRRGTRFMRCDPLRGRNSRGRSPPGLGAFCLQIATDPQVACPRDPVCVLRARWLQIGCSATDCIMTARDLDRAFPAHLATIAARTDQALSACGFDALAIFSGRPPNHFLDDAGWPFKVNPHFKLWAPLTDAPESFICHVPGRGPMLCFYQPADY